MATFHLPKIGLHGLGKTGRIHLGMKPGPKKGMPRKMGFKPNIGLGKLRIK